MFGEFLLQLLAQLFVATAYHVHMDIGALEQHPDDGADDAAALGSAHDGDDGSLMGRRRRHVHEAAAHGKAHLDDPVGFLHIGNGALIGFPGRREYPIYARIIPVLGDVDQVHLVCDQRDAQPGVVHHVQHRGQKNRMRGQNGVRAKAVQQRQQLCADHRCHHGDHRLPEGQPR